MGGTSDGILNLSFDFLNIGAIAYIVDQINKSLSHKDYVKKGPPNALIIWDGLQAEDNLEL